VDIPAATVDSLTETTEVPAVTVKTNAGSVTLDSDAMKAVIAAASTTVDSESTVTKDVSISLTKTTPVGNSDGTSAAYDVDVTVSDGATTTEPLSKDKNVDATITLTLPMPQTTNWYIYYALKDTTDGTKYNPLELMASSSKYTEKDGMVVIKTSHLSTYIERANEAATPAISAYDYAYSKTVADEKMLEDIQAVKTNATAANVPTDNGSNTMWTLFTGLNTDATYKIEYYRDSDNKLVCQSGEFKPSGANWLTRFSFDNTTQVELGVTVQPGAYTCNLYLKVGATDYSLIAADHLTIYDNQTQIIGNWQTYTLDASLDALVPGSDMKYNAVPAINKAMRDGYTALWKAAGNEAYTTSKDVNDAVTAELETQKASLMSAVKEYVLHLLNTIYNGGEAYVVSDTSYYLPTSAYDTATQAIQDADDFSAVTNALPTAVRSQFTLAEGEKLVTVTLNANGGKFSDGNGTKVATNKDSVALGDVDMTVTRNGYVLTGWYTEASEGTQVNTSTPITANTTLYAHWSYVSNSATSFEITVAASEGGKVTASKVKAAKDNNVTLTVTADKGKALDTLTVTDASGNKIAVTKKANGTYTFTMPASKVTVTATFKDSDGTEEPAQGVSFTDVNKNQWYNAAIEYVVSKGIMEGYGNDKFGPNDHLTRAQLAQILYNAAGAPEVTSESPFTDVTAGKWYTAAITWAYENGVVEGYGNGKFGPNDEITREQLATMIWRYAGEVKATTDSLSSFTDAAKVSSYAQDALLWATEKAIVQGDKNVLDPKGNATRAQAATMIMRYLELG
jgi:uncharacterized repeat protein (TIGR02543 family)